MNIFLISPGRTATKTLASAFSNIEGFTSGHETRVNLLGMDRIDYPPHHIECDNRLTWFLPRLTHKYASSGVLVIVKRDKDKIAQSYNHRWHNIFIMKAYSQGILLRDLSENTYPVCQDYVANVYEHLAYFSSDWSKVVSLDIDSPEEGVYQLLEHLGKLEHYDLIVKYFNTTHQNKNAKGIVPKLKILKFNIRNLLYDLVKN